MRLSASSLLLPALACLAQADLGRLNIYQAVPASTTGIIVNAETARLIIASHLGLDRYHSLAHTDDASLDAINQFAPEQHIFSSSADRSVALLLGEGIEDDNDLRTKSVSHHALVQNIPSIASTEHLLLDLAQQSGLRNIKKQDMDTFQSSTHGVTFRIAKSQEDFEHSLDTLLQQEYTVLTLTVPNDTASKHTYGSYSMPASTHATLHKRVYQEAPLMTDVLPAVDSLPKLAATLAPSTSSASGPLRGILPQCFSSASTCQSMTRNCSGHGSCTLKYTDKDASTGGAPCYSCACVADVRKVSGGGIKTTNWGGAACQKKDVVMPFWLLGGFTVLLVSVVAWAIGMLLDMGNEELPSVIGAGVSGVSRPK